VTPEKNKLIVEVARKVYKELTHRSKEKVADQQLPLPHQEQRALPSPPPSLYHYPNNQPSRGESTHSDIHLKTCGLP